MYGQEMTGAATANDVPVYRFTTVGLPSVPRHAQRSFSLDGYLNIAVKAQKNGKVRKDLTAEELALEHTLMRKYYDMNILVTEILMINRILKRLNDPKISALTNNLYRVMNSLARQRDKVYVVRKSIFALKPEAYEVEYIRRMIMATENRMKFVREKILPENIELTPLKEYLELIGEKSMTEDIYEKIGNRKELVEVVTRGGDPEGKLDRYLEQVLETVRKAGKETAYQERIAKWYERSERIRAERDAEEKAEKDERSLKDAEAYMRYFRSEFNRCIRTLEGNNMIGISRIGVEKMLNVNGRDCWVIIRCYMYADKPVFRYYKCGEHWKRELFGSKLFSSEEEAREVMRRFAEKFPGQAFDVMKLGYAEDAYV